MFNDKTSLIICAIVYTLLVFGAALGWLDYYLVSGLIVVGAVIVFINIYKTKKVEDEDDKFV